MISNAFQGFTMLLYNYFQHFPNKELNGFNLDNQWRGGNNKIFSG